MKSHLFCSRVDATGNPSINRVTISPWVNEPIPDLREILCARDVARLTRRPGWILYGLALIGRFPRKRRYRGRPIGWQRLEVLDWLTKGLDAANDADFNKPSQTLGAPLKHSLQDRSPLEFGTECALAGECTGLARKVVAQSRLVPNTRATGAPPSPEHGHE
jgi:predicted DNA-binding transcriptional regulator AlpA